jgi:hypothetical protein
MTLCLAFEATAAPMKAISMIIPTSNIKPSVAIISPACADVTVSAGSAQHRGDTFQL